MKTFYKWIWCFIILFSSLIPGFGMYDLIGSNPVIQLYRPFQVQYSPDPTPGIASSTGGILDIVVVDSLTGEPLNDEKVAVSTTTGVTITDWTEENGALTLDHSRYTATTAELTKSGMIPW